MTATERLRALLTERGVEWRGGLPTETMVEADGLDLLYVALPDGRVRAFIRNYLTPEQAIEATLGRDKYSYKQWREISNAVGDAMEYAHNKAIECPDKADPLWNLDEYVNRILKAAFEGEATLGERTCRIEYGPSAVFRNETGPDWTTQDFVARCSECGHRMHQDPFTGEWPRFCPNCGARVVES